MVLNGGERLAQAGPDLSRNSGERTQDFFLLSCSRLLLCEDISATAIPGAQPQDVLISHARDRAFQNRGAAGTLANLPRNVGSERRCRAADS